MAISFEDFLRKHSALSVDCSTGRVDIKMASDDGSMVLIDGYCGAGDLRRIADAMDEYRAACANDRP